MSCRYRVKTLGLLLAATFPALTSAQGRSGRAGGDRIGTTGTLAPHRPAPPRMIGFGDGPRAQSPGDTHAGGDWGRMRMGRRGGIPFVGPRFGGGWSYPVMVATPQPYAVPVPAPYPVPYYYRVPIASASANREPETPPPPYDPTRSRMLIIGAGSDGGGGSMRIARLVGDTLRVLWLGENRPVREATVFLANAGQRPLRSRVVDLDHPEVLFNLTGLDGALSYTGLTVVFGDGSTRTTLVPFIRGPSRDPSGQRPEL